MLSTIMVVFGDAVASDVGVAASSDSPAPLLAPSPGANQELLNGDAFGRRDLRHRSFACLFVYRDCANRGCCRFTRQRSIQGLKAEAELHGAGRMVTK
jgi:hypothetical protein